METKLKDALTKLKALLFADEAAAEVVKVDIKGKDGKSYKAAKVEAGEAIENEDGTPAADGSIELEDGSFIVVKDGKIESLKAAEALAADAAAIDAPPAADKAPEVTKEAFDALQSQVNAITEQLAQLLSGATANSEAMKAVYSAIDALGEEPTAEATDKIKIQAFKVISPKEQAMKTLKESFDKLNKAAKK